MNRIIAPVRVLEDEMLGLHVFGGFRKYPAEGTTVASEKPCSEMSKIFASREDTRLC